MRISDWSSDVCSSDLEVFVDGGIRRGSDIVKAIALGADAVMIGRAVLYGLGAAGGAGVHRALEILAQELRRTMQLLGVIGPDCIDASLIARKDIEDHLDFAAVNDLLGKRHGEREIGRAHVRTPATNC